MPRKSKKSTEPEPAGATQPVSESANSAAAAPEPAPKKRARKTASRKTASAERPSAAAEAGAQAADAFGDAMEANDPSEVGAAEAQSETEAPKKKARAKKAAKAAKPAPEPEPEPEPQPEVGPDEFDELAGDWESGSGSEEEEEEEQDEDEEPAEEDEDEEPEEASAPRPPGRLERLQKILAAAGIASRRHAEELITEGRVQVNGQVVTTLGSKADASRDHIRVDGKLLHGAERLRYFVLNKPREYVTTVSDPEGRPTVMEFFSKMGERLYPVGRLDYQSEGLLLMTNDGDLANRLTRAASGVEKTYLVKVSGQPDEDLIEQLREGISIDRGRPGEGRVRTAPAQIRQVRAGENPWFEISLIEGRNRELRKMFEEIGHHVEKIRRVGYGPLVLDQEPGHFRELEAEELELLRLAAEGKWKPKRVKTTTMLPKEAGRSVDHESGRRGGKPFRNGGNRGGQRSQGDDRRGRPGFARPGTDRPRFDRDDRGRAQDRSQDRRQDRDQSRGQDRAGAQRGSGFSRPRPEGGRAEHPARPQGGFSQDRPQRRRNEGGFEPRRGLSRDFGGHKDFTSERPARSFTGDRGREGSSRPPRFREDRPAEGGFADRGFKDRRQSGQGRPGAQGRFQGPPRGGRPFRERPNEDRGNDRERPRFQDRGQDQTRGPVRGADQRRERPQGNSSRPRPDRPAGGGFTPRPGGGRPQGRPSFGASSERRGPGGPPRGGAPRTGRPEGRGPGSGPKRDNNRGANRGPNRGPGGPPRGGSNRGPNRGPGNRSNRPPR